MDSVCMAKPRRTVEQLCRVYITCNQENSGCQRAGVTAQE